MSEWLEELSLIFGPPVSPRQGEEDTPYSRYSTIRPIFLCTYSLGTIAKSGTTADMEALFILTLTSCESYTFLSSTSCANLALV